MKTLAEKLKDREHRIANVETVLLNGEHLSFQEVRRYKAEIESLRAEIAAFKAKIAKGRE